MALAGLLLGWAVVALGVIAVLGLTLFVVAHTGQAGAVAHPGSGGPPPPPPP
jgi:hypothetical protein